MTIELPLDNFRKKALRMTFVDDIHDQVVQKRVSQIIKL